MPSRRYRAVGSNRSRRCSIFEEDQNDVNVALNEAINNKDNSKSLYHYSSYINKNFSNDKKLLLIEALWEIALADGERDIEEDALLRLVANLLGISDVESASVRKRISAS